MAPKVNGLIDQLALTQKDLDAARKKFDATRTAFEGDESQGLIEGRAPDLEFRKKLAELELLVSLLESKRKAIERTIAELRDRDLADRGQREYEQREAFKQSARPQISALLKATYQMRNSVEAFFAVLGQQNPPLAIVDLVAFLFPPGDVQNPMDDMNRRFNQIALVNAAMSWVSDDIMHSRKGPQQPKGSN